MDPVVQDLMFLTGSETSGRLSGTEGARRASAYLAGELKSLGLIPVGDDEFFQWLEVPAARLTGPVRLAVGGTHYRHRHDFGEIAHVSSGGAVQSNIVVIRDGDEVRPEEIQGKAVLIPKRPDGFDLNATAAAALEVGASALLVEWGEPTWFHKTVFGSADSRIPVIRIRESLAERLASDLGAAVELDLPLEVHTEPCRNVLGLLPGADPTRTVALTAHYDHVGDDPDGERFPGAIDNASGVVAMLAVIRRLVEQRVALPFNILVAFLTGEESGLWGAKHLARRSPVPLSAVINLDGMGLEPALRAIRLGYSAPGNWLANVAAELYQEHGIEVRWTVGGDDSVAFQAAGLPALGLGHMSTEPLRVRIHTPDDTSAVLHVPAIEEGAETIVSLIRRLAVHPALAQ